MACLRFTTLCLLVALVTILKFGTCLEEDYDIDETERIVGGKNAENGQFPWTVALYYEGKFACTGSIISERSILTAGHCVVFNNIRQEASSFHATVGNVNRTASSVVYLNFYKITLHPQYRGLDNDVAILETLEPFSFSKTIAPICIASPNFEKLVGKRVIAMGWGQINKYISDPYYPDILQYTPQQVISNYKCHYLYHGSPVPEYVMCARGIKSGICFADSGGPLVFYKGKKAVQVGIASFIRYTKGCGEYLDPAGFARISSYSSFITKSAAGSVCVEE